MSTMNRMFQKLLPGSERFLTHLTPCSLPAAISEPVKVTEPIMTPRPAVMEHDDARSALPGEDVIERDKGRRTAAHGVEHGDELRHVGHLDPLRRGDAGDGTYDDARDQQPDGDCILESGDEQFDEAMTTATTMPAAEMKLPLRAVFGEFM